MDINQRIAIPIAITIIGWRKKGFLKNCNIYLTYIM